VGAFFGFSTCLDVMLKGRACHKPPLLTKVRALNVRNALDITNRSFMLVVKLYIRFRTKAVYRMELARWTAADYLTLILLSLGLSLDDFGLAFTQSLLMPSGTFKKLMVNAGKMAVAFSISSALLPLLGWLVGLAM